VAYQEGVHHHVQNHLVLEPWQRQGETQASWKERKIDEAFLGRDHQPAPVRSDSTKTSRTELLVFQGVHLAAKRQMTHLHVVHLQVVLVDPSP